MNGLNYDGIRPIFWDRVLYIPLKELLKQIIIFQSCHTAYRVFCLKYWSGCHNLKPFCRLPFPSMPWCTGVHQTFGFWFLSLRTQVWLGYNYVLREPTSCDVEQSVYLVIRKGTIDTTKDWKHLMHKIKYISHEKLAFGPGCCPLLHLIIGVFLSYTL